jgi:hypothetical protein
MRRRYPRKGAAVTEQERRALFFKVTGTLYCHAPMEMYQAFCKGIEYEREECAKEARKHCSFVAERAIRARG